MSEERLIVLLIAGALLLWAAWGLAPAVAGLRRWRWRAAGARRAMLSGALAVVLPGLGLALCAAFLTWPDRPPPWLRDSLNDWAEPLSLTGLACAVLAQAALVAAAWAAGAAARSAEVGETGDD